MSVDTKLGDLSKNQIALIVILVAISIVLVTYGIAVYIGFSSCEVNCVTVGGEINFSEIQTIVLVIVTSGLTVLGITVASNQVRAAIKENDQTWLTEQPTSSASMVPFSPTDAKRGIGYEFEDLMKKTILMTMFVRKIYESDSTLTPAEQQDAIQILSGVTAAEMEELIPLTGPTLADSIRKLIGKHRATNRTDKDQNT